MSELKTLVTCKPSEFLTQTNLIKKSVEKWLTLTDVINIRRRMPALETVPIEATVEEKAAIFARNKEKAREQARKNISVMLDAILEEHPAETLEVLALCCFIDPKDVDNYPVTAYLEAFNSLVGEKAVIDFFISLASLARMNTLTASKA